MSRPYYTAMGLFYFVVPFYLFRGLVSSDPHRFQSVCSLMAALTLSMTGVRELLGGPVSSLQRKETTELYMVYTVMDMLLGFVYYPHLMKWWEGWFHHTATGGFALYCLYTGRYHVFSPCMIVEVPTIFLTLPRLFPSLYSLRKYVFPPVFALCRLGLFNLHVVWLWRRGDLTVGELWMALGFNCLNAHWMHQTLWKKGPRPAPPPRPTA